jgi:uncharacterized protein YbaP (TraB family)
MRRRFLPLIGLVILAGWINSCTWICKPEPVPAPTPAAAHANPDGEKAKEKKLFLWKIETGNKKQESFILGSVHFLKKEFYPLDPTIEKAFAQSALLAVETYATPVERLTAFMKKGIYKADEPDTLENQISKKTYLLVKEKLKTYGMDTGLFKKFKPWYLAQTISYMEIAGRGYEPGQGLDVYFLEKAKKVPGKEIIALEKLAEQIDFYDRLPPRVNGAYLLTSLEKTSGSEDNQGIEAVAAAWSRGDTRAMERLLNREIKKKPGLEMLYEKLIYERNRNMAKRMGSLLKSGDKGYFFLVGAFHLVGKRGIIQLLKDNGFRVRQL